MDTTVSQKEETPDENLMDELIIIRQELQKLHDYKLFQLYDSFPKLLFVQFSKGVAFGLGSFLGASLVVSVVIYLLSQIEFIPFIGEFVKLIMEEIKK